MVLYEYKCEYCGSESQEIYKMGTAPSTIKCFLCDKQAPRNYKVSVSVSNPTSEARKGRGRG